MGGRSQDYKEGWVSGEGGEVQGWQVAWKLFYRTMGELSLEVWSIRLACGRSAG